MKMATVNASGNRLGLMLLSGTLFVLLLVTPAHSVDPPQLFAYDRSTSDVYEFYLSTRNAEPDLAGYRSLELTTTSQHLTCRIGGWILYSGANFTGTSTPLPFARSLLCNHVATGSSFRSARFAGSPDDILAQTLTLYSRSTFVGQDTLLLAALADLSGVGPVGSVYRTGAGPWKLYTGVGYTGFSFCMEEDMITDLSTIMPIVQSAQRGCESIE